MSGYKRYLENHKRHANKFYNVEQMNEHHNRLIKFNEYMVLSKWWKGNGYIEELEENKGYFYYNGEIEFSMKSEYIDILNAIVVGDLQTIKKLNNAGYIIGCYKNIKIRLAIIYNHIDIIKYFINAKQYNMWFSINSIVGELAPPIIFDKILSYALSFKDMDGDQKEKDMILDIYFQSNKYNNNILTSYIEHKYKQFIY